MISPNPGGIAERSYQVARELQNRGWNIAVLTQAEIRPDSPIDFPFPVEYVLPERPTELGPPAAIHCVATRLAFAQCIYVWETRCDGFHAWAIFADDSWPSLWASGGQTDSGCRADGLRTLRSQIQLCSFNRLDIIPVEFCRINRTAMCALSRKKCVKWSSGSDFSFLLN